MQHHLRRALLGTTAVAVAVRPPVNVAVTVSVRPRAKRTRWGSAANRVKLSPSSGTTAMAIVPG